MPRELIKCQCAYGTKEHGPCKRDATAEDFRCDYCRDGCATFTIGDGPTNAHVGFRGDPEGLFIDATGGR